jgi:hypothetical protein
VHQGIVVKRPINADPLELQEGETKDSTELGCSDQKVVPAAPTSQVNQPAGEVRPDRKDNPEFPRHEERRR